MNDKCDCIACHNKLAREKQEHKAETITVLQDMDADNELTPDGILDAILEGKIPNVYFKE